MQIIKDKNNVVLFAGEGFQLTDKKLIAPGWTSPAVNSRDHILEEVTSIPADYKGGYFTYNGQWTQIKFDVKPPEQIAAETTEAIQTMLDTKAKAYRYDSIHTACGWADKFDDAMALKDWGSACWIKAKQIEQEVIAGTRPLPTASEVISEMPIFMETE